VNQGDRVRLILENHLPEPSPRSSGRGAVQF
jgi:hypothetical protein